MRHTRTRNARSSHQCKGPVTGAGGVGVQLPGSPQRGWPLTKRRQSSVPPSSSGHHSLARPCLWYFFLSLLLLCLVFSVGVLVGVHLPRDREARARALSSTRPVYVPQHERAQTDTTTHTKAAAAAVDQGIGSLPGDSVGGRSGGGGGGSGSGGALEADRDGGESGGGGVGGTDGGGGGGGPSPMDSGGGSGVSGGSSSGGGEGSTSGGGDGTDAVASAGRHSSDSGGNEGTTSHAAAADDDDGGGGGGGGGIDAPHGGDGPERGSEDVNHHEPPAPPPPPQPEPLELHLHDDGKRHGVGVGGGTTTRGNEESGRSRGYGQGQVTGARKSEALLGVRSSLQGRSVADAGPISAWVAQGKSFPIVMTACNRPELLRKTLDSLLQVRGVSAGEVLVVQDGAMGSVAEVVREKGIQLVQSEGGTNLRGGAPKDGSVRIAMHYKFALSTAFDRFPEAPAVVVLEEDLLFSPDVMEYFVANAPILELDETTFVLSAWNDNGFAGLVQDPHRLHRTEFFPGLGWLLPRALYQKELETEWPSEHWDHWLRSEERHKGRDCVYPEVPRTFHNGVKGTFMDDRTHQRYFARIAYNVDPSVRWDVYKPGKGWEGHEDMLSAVKAVYDEGIGDAVANATHVRDLADLEGLKSNAAVVWYEVDSFEPVGKYFQIWHEEQRGSYKGVHHLFDNKGSLLLLINAQTSAYAGSKLNGARVFQTNDFSTQRTKRVPPPPLPKGTQLVAAEQPGLSCDDVCQGKGMVCSAKALPSANDCDVIRRHLPCEQGCQQNFGYEQPAYVMGSAARDKLPGYCLLSERPHESTCEAAHPLTRRLCTCT